MQNWTLGTPAFTSTLGELSRKVQTPWLLYVPFFCGDADGGNVYEKEGFRFVQVGNAQHKTLSISVGLVLKHTDPDCNRKSRRTELRAASSQGVKDTTQFSEPHPVGHKATRRRTVVSLLLILPLPLLEPLARHAGGHF